MTFMELILVVTYIRNLKNGKPQKKKKCNAGIKRQKWIRNQNKTELNR